MELSREWVSVRASVLLTFAVAVCSVVVGLLHIGGVGVGGPLAPYVPSSIQQAVGFTGTVTGVAMLASGFALLRGYRIGWYSTAVLLPLAAAQGLLQTSAVSLLLVAFSLASVVPLAVNRGRFDRRFVPSPTQLAAGTALGAAVAYGTVGSYALREEFAGVDTLVDAFYFTIVTASTVGYGDVTPATGITKLFVLSSLVLNVAAFAVALGVLLTPAIEAQLSKALGTMTNRQFELLDDHVLVLGYGDLTEPILDGLDEQGHAYAVVTTDETATRRLTERSVPVLTADPSDVDPLRRVRIEDARAVVVAAADDARDALAILTARQLNPDVRIVAAATQRENIDKLRRAGADRVISPSVLGGQMLVDSAFGTDDADALTRAADDAVDSGDAVTAESTASTNGPDEPTEQLTSSPR